MKSDFGQQGSNRNPGAAIETTEITNPEMREIAHLCRERMQQLNTQNLRG
jgi:hypothetical protein